MYFQRKTSRSWYGYEEAEECFLEGIRALKEASFSIADCIGDAETECDVVASLAANVAFDRPTGNGVDWGRCSIDISPWGVKYTTTGGLSFGWGVDVVYPRGDGVSYTFWCRHPSGSFEKGSTLAKALLEAGFTASPDEEDEDVFVGEKLSASNCYDAEAEVKENPGRFFTSLANPAKGESFGIDTEGYVTVYDAELRPIIQHRWGVGRENPEDLHYGVFVR